MNLVLSIYVCMSIAYFCLFVGSSGNKRRREPEGFRGDEGSV